LEIHDERKRCGGSNVDSVRPRQDQAAKTQARVEDKKLSREALTERASDQGLHNKKKHARPWETAF
jgi:hypothetical protein